MYARIAAIAAAVLFVPAAWAQAKCNISLPYRLEQISDCSPQSAAAYDLAFCAVSYSNAEEPFKTKAAAYFKISQGLAGTDALSKNVELVKKYYQALKGAERGVSTKAYEYIREKCANVETHHAPVLEDLAKKLKLQKY